MAVSEMEKLSAVVMKSDARKLTRALMKLRCVEIEVEMPDGAADAEHSAPTTARSDEEIRAAERECARIDNVLAALHRIPAKKKKLLSPCIEVDTAEFTADGRYARAVALLDEADGLLSRIAQTDTESARSESLIASYSVWRGCDMPLDFEHTAATSTLLGVFPSGTKAAELTEAFSSLPVSLGVYGEDGSGLYVSVTYHGSAADEVSRILLSRGFLRQTFRGVHTGAEEALCAEQAKLSSLAEEREKCRNRLRELAFETELLEILYDMKQTELTELDAAGKYTPTESALILSAWLPKDREADVSKALEAQSAAYEYTAPENGEDVPVLLRNNKFASPFEFVLGLYAYPKYTAYDPTFVMSIFYFIIFGLMFADVGYGLLLTVGCIIGLRLMKPKKGMRNLLTLFAICGVSCVAAGALLGGYFGDLPTKIMTGFFGIENPPQIAIWFDPLSNPMLYLILSLAVGAVHILTAMGINAYVQIKRGKWKDALMDTGSWYLLFAGIGSIFLFPSFGKYVAIAGVAALVLTQGRHEKNVIMKFLKGLLSLYGVINYAADLLSYSRIFALGLAASVIASVVNTVGTLNGPTFVGFIIFIFAFLIGHLLNIAINLLGTFVHTSRLQYIEFFGKFYEEGGRPFRPVEPYSRYTMND